MNAQRICFVAQAFGQKTDYHTGRQIDLDASYAVIKDAVVSLGLTCVRLDEVVSVGSVYGELFKLLYHADIVIADLSTYSLSVAYGLGVRLAWRKQGTIVVAEKEFKSPFDVTIPVISYEHGGKTLRTRHADAFKQSLQSAVQAALAGTGHESPVYEFLKLEPPGLSGVLAGAPADPIVAPPPSPGFDERVAKLIEKARESIAHGNHAQAAMWFAKAREHRRGDPWIVQQLAQATASSQDPDPRSALVKAREILGDLKPDTANDPETLGLWGSVHKRLWELTREPPTLDVAIAAYERGFRLSDDCYNGINFAFLLDARALESDAAGDRDEAVTDAILARRVRGKVMTLCEKALDAEQDPDSGSSPGRDERYRVLATMEEAAVGLGDEAAAVKYHAMRSSAAPPVGGLETTDVQIARLRTLLASSPLKPLRPGKARKGR